MSGKERQIEQFIHDFVLAKTQEHVELCLKSSIQIVQTPRRNSKIRYRHRPGSTMLAIFWAKILQHEDNFPTSKYKYKQVGTYTADIRE